MSKSNKHDSENKVELIKTNVKILVEGMTPSTLDYIISNKHYDFYSRLFIEYLGGYKHSTHQIDILEKVKYFSYQFLLDILDNSKQPSWKEIRLALDLYVANWRLLISNFDFFLPEGSLSPTKKLSFDYLNAIYLLRPYTNYDF